MKYYSLFFSPTGGTKKVMDLLSQELSPAHTDIDISCADTDYSAYTFGPDDICLLGVPSYGGRVPAVVIERLHCMKADNTAVILVTSYGNRAYDDTLLELKAEAAACGFLPAAAIAAVTEHSIMHQYGTGRPDNTDEQELRGFARKLREHLADINTSISVSVPGNMPYREYGGVPLKPKADKSCSKCGVCAQQCPVNAIPKDSPDQTDSSLCISCMRCIAVCPKHARSLNSIMLFAAGKKLKQACSGRKQNELFWGTGAV